MKCKDQFIVCLAVLLYPYTIMANPEGGIVTAGDASIDIIGNRLEVVQQSPKAIIDWQKFDITSTEHTHFKQTSVDAVALNRIHSHEASKIEGTLTADGKLILINQNGLMFGKDAKVDVSSLLATTTNISNEEFMRSDRIEQLGLKFNLAGKHQSKIINEGNINGKGLIGLVAPNVVNNGVIVAKTGKVTLSSGEVFTLDLYGDELLAFGLSDEQQSQLVLNSGEIMADGGKILLTSAAGETLVNSFIVNTGVLQAKSIYSNNGEIIIAAAGSNAVPANLASEKGKKEGSSKVIIKGSLDVSGEDVGERGGKVVVTGDEIGLLSGTLINASGHSGLANTTKGIEKSAKRLGAAGGEILIGGDYLGQGKLPTAKNLYVAPDVIILNDAIEHGDAGRTIFWSDETTDFYGTVFARALGGNGVEENSHDPIKGGNIGDGGFVETSGKLQLNAQGYVNLLASHGETGTYLLDPSAINIYGNFDPTFVSSDSGANLNLQQNLKVWLDFSDQTKVQLSYNTGVLFSNTVSNVTASGSIGSNALTVTASSNLRVGSKIKLAADSAARYAYYTDPDIYTITNINTNSNISVSPALTKTYSNVQINQGYIINVDDKSGGNNNAVAINAGSMPVWLAGKQNGLGVSNFDRNAECLAVKTKNATAGTEIDYIKNQTNFTYIVSYNVNGSKVLAGSTSEPNLFSIARANLSAGYYIIAYKPLGPNITRPPLQFYNGSSGTWSFVGGNYLVSYNVPHVTSVVNDYSNTKKIGLYIDGTLKNGLENSPSYSISNILPNVHAIGSIIHDTGGGVLAPMDPFIGNIQEVIEYNVALTDHVRNMLEQYQAVKWNIPLTTDPAISYSAGSNATSSVTAEYLNKLSKTADVIIAADSVNLDLKNATLNIDSDKNFNLTAVNSINILSNGAIATTRSTSNKGNINLQLNNGNLDLSKLNLNANNNGVINVTASLGNITLGNMTAGSINVTTNGSSTNIIVPDGINLITTNPTTPLNLNATGQIIDNSKKDLIITPIASNLILIYGDPISNLSSLVPITLTGYIAPDNYNTDSTTGSAIMSTNYVTGNGIGSYNLVIQKGTLASGSVKYNVVGNTINNFIQVHPRPLRITANIQSKTYGSSDPMLTYTHDANGLVNGDQANIITGGLTRISGEAVGSYSINNNNLNAGNNYTVDYVGANFIINPKNLIITAVATHKTYGQSDPNLTYTYDPNNLVNGDQPSIITGTLSRVSGEAAGSYAINKNTLSAGSNYLINYNGANFTINPKNLTIVAAAKSKIYGSIDPLLTYTYTQNELVNGDQANIITGTLAREPGKNVGIYKIQRNTLNAGNNYNIEFTEADFEINPKYITVRVLDYPIKEYDGTTVANVHGLNYNLQSVLANDNLLVDTSAASGIYNNAKTGEKLVTITGLQLAGIDRNNYRLSLNNNVNSIGTIGLIRPKKLNVELNAINKIYDGTTNVKLSDSDYKPLNGIINGEQVALKKVFNATLESAKNIGVPQNVKISGLTLIGTDQNNYTLIDINSTLPFTTIVTTIANPITVIPKTLTVKLQGNLTKPYDGNTKVIIDDSKYGNLMGIVGNEKVTLKKVYTGNYNSKNVNQANEVTVNGLSLEGQDKSNYVLEATSLTLKDNRNTTQLNVANKINVYIVPKPLKLDLDNPTKEYDAASTVQLGNYNLAGVVGADQVNLINKPSTGFFVTPNVIGKSNVNIQGLQITGNDAANYVIPDKITISGTITRKPLIVALRPNISKVYDGTAIVNLTSNDYILTGNINSADNVTLFTPRSGVFADTNIGNNKILKVTGIKLQGPAGNVAKYSLNNNTTVLERNDGIITAKSLMISIDNKTKIYGIKDPVLTYTASGSMAKEPIKLYRQPGENVGSYLIDVDPSSSINYNVIKQISNPNLTITKANLTVTANSYTRKAGANNPIFQFSARGLANNDTVDIIKNAAGIQLSCLATATAVKNNKYPITVTGASSTNNYNIKYMNGLLTIN